MTTQAESRQRAAALSRESSKDNDHRTSRSRAESLLSRSAEPGREFFLAPLNSSEQRGPIGRTNSSRRWTSRVRSMPRGGACDRSSTATTSVCGSHQWAFKKYLLARRVRFVILNTKHLKRTLASHFGYYHESRTHSRLHKQFHSLGRCRAPEGPSQSLRSVACITVMNALQRNDRGTDPVLANDMVVDVAAPIRLPNVGRLSVLNPECLRRLPRRLR
jgi:hypothetical protein